MSSEDILTTKKLKREYSKGGCRECKRRKIKCSEEKPLCWQCKRLLKECSYPKAGEKVVRVSKRKLDEFRTHPLAAKPLVIQRYVPREGNNNIVNNIGALSIVKTRLPEIAIIDDENKIHHGNRILSHNQEAKVLNSYDKGITNSHNNNGQRYRSTSIINLLNENNSPVINGHNNSSNISLTSVSPLPNNALFNNQGRPEMFPTNSNNLLMYGDTNDYYNRTDLNILASDLNNLVSNMMYESNFDSNSNFPFDLDTENFFNSLMNNTHEHSASNINSEVIGRDIPVDYIKATNRHEKIYLEQFYNDFANKVLPFNSYDKDLKIYFNPARDIILQCASKESFLLAAILAQGAKSAFKKCNLHEDEEAYGKYLNKCLKLLEPALNNNGDKKEIPDLQSNIEVLLVTVLLLTCANAVNVKQDWRPHLKGAKDLLLRHSSKQIKNSKILIFCKFWFISFEILAGLSSKQGGTLKTDSELDSLITPGNDYEIQVLRELGVILDNDFNIMGGYYNECVLYFRDLIKVLNKVRDNGEKYVPSPNETQEYLRLLSELYKQSEKTFVNKRNILKPSDFSNGQIPDGLLLDTLMIQNEKIIISWMDTSHQAYVQGAIITLLTKLLHIPYNSPNIQNLNSSLVGLITFLKNCSEISQQMTRYSMMMIQWPMLIAGTNCVDEENKYLMTKFFRISEQIGCGSASYSLIRLEKLWYLREHGTDCQVEYDDEMDILSY